MKCAFCQNGEGKIPITDSKTLRSVELCKECYNEMQWKPKEKEVELKGLDEDYFKKGIKNHPKTKDCDDSECMLCGYRDCPHNEPLHYHHDGCPACISEEFKDFEYNKDEEEWNLSNKIVSVSGESTHMISRDNVKEFIKIITDGFITRFYGSDIMPTVAYDEFLDFIKEKAGDKLK